MHGAAWPIGPVLGQVFRGFAYNGRAWVKSRGAEWSNVQVFTSSGRYQPSEDLIYVIVECWGPGGGGGWAQPVGISGQAAAGGGGSGGYSRKTLPAELVIQGADVVIGAGGIVGVGVPGGGFAADTSFGGLCVAKGGGNAFAYDGNHTLPDPIYGPPGPGAPLGVGDVTFPGVTGFPWTSCQSQAAAETQSLLAGMGGSLLGGNSINTSALNWPFTNQGGTNGAPNSGSGGTGGQVFTGAAISFGGSGGTGLCVVTEICGTENGGGGPGPEPPGTGRPPGVPIKVNARVALTHVPFDPDAPYVDPRAKR